jgi:uncharacterized membrane protein YhaH (DUF805 family)
MNYSTILFSFTGRLNRARYWLAGITTGVVGMLIVLGIAVGIGRANLATVGLAVPVFLALIWISLALAIKRLHDRDKSAWWLLLFYLAPSILQVVGSRVGSVTIIPNLIGIGISIWAFVEIGCLRGTAGSNSYGLNPLQVS